MTMIARVLFPNIRIKVIFYCRIQVSFNYRVKMIMPPICLVDIREKFTNQGQGKQGVSCSK